MVVHATACGLTCVSLPMLLSSFLYQSHNPPAQNLPQVYDPKKSYYKKCLYEPLPVESCLQQHLASYLLAEVASGMGLGE